MSSDLQIVRDIQAFHRAGEVPTAPRPAIPPADRAVLRARLIREEVGETLRALSEEDLVEIADGIADSIVVLVGTALEYGIDLTPVWTEVCRSNMTKFPKCETCKGEGYNGPNVVRGRCDDCNGRGTQLLLRDDGKIQKPEGWTPPEIERLLIEQGMEPK